MAAESAVFGFARAVFRGSRVSAHVGQGQALRRHTVGRAFSTSSRLYAFSCQTRTRAARERPPLESSLLRTQPIATQLARTLSTTQRRHLFASEIGAEPGASTALPYSKALDPNGHPQTSDGVQADIQIIDYSDERVFQHEVNPSTLENFLRENEKPQWAACRWIYVNGLDPKIVNVVGKAKRLHRLTVEDVLDTNTPTKVDWYEDHCFMEMPLQKIFHLDHHHHQNGQHDEHDVPSAEALREALRQPRQRILSRKLGISVEQVSVFLTADNTVITFFEQSGTHILNPILTRLNSPQTIVRSTNDPWMLVQAVIDAVVDLSLPIGKAVADVFSELEYAVLSAPAIAQSKEIYVLRSGLTMLMDNTNAIGGLVRTLCDHRDARDSASVSASSTHSIPVSPTMRVYLQDVQDHITTLYNSTKMSIRSAENLTSLIFNTIAASQNESVRQLTLVSCFFLPLTFLTGYFGMNFDPMPVVNEHSDAFFWVIASPIMVTVLLVMAVRHFRVGGFLRRRGRGKR